MVTGSRTSGNRGVGLDDGAKKMIQSIKEIVGNHSDADIYTALKEANMDPDEAVQKLIHQDPFHEVKRKRDRKKEDTVVVEPANRKKPLESVTSEVKVRTQPEYNVRRGGYHRNFVPRNAAQRNAFPRNPATGSNREFRVVRDNRSNPNVDEELKHSSGSNINKVVATVNKKGSTSGLDNHDSSGAQDVTDDRNTAADVRPRQPEIAPLHRPTNKGFSDGKQTVGGVTLPPTNSVLGVYASSTDPVHVPSPVSRSSPVGAIKREVRGGGFGKPSENVGKEPSVRSFPGSTIRKNGPPNAYRPSSPTPKIDHSQTTAREPNMPSGVEKSRSFLNRQRGNRGSQYARTQQVGGHTKGVSQNKEWKPKSTQKPVGHNPGVIGTPTKSQARRPADNSINVESEAVELQDKLSHVHISESQNVIIADHIRIPETDRCHLTFGSFVQEFDSSRNSASAIQESCSLEELRDSDHSLPVSCPEASTDGPDVQPINILDDHVRISASESPVSPVSEPQLPEQKEINRSDNLDEYSGVQSLNRNGPPYTPLQFEQQQDPPELQKFSAYDHHGGYEFPYFNPATDETMRGQGLPSPQEVLSTHMVNNAPPSTIPMLQQQQQASMQQMYPQVHVSHYPNLMPYRQFLSPFYVPQVPMTGYSGNPAAYAHPSNGNGYVLMPAGGSNGVKYGIHQQFKPVATSGHTGFQTYNNPSGYPMNSPNVVGNATGLEDSSRMKYKDGNIYTPNPQSETSEIWMTNPRDLSSLQSPQYYNVAGQTPHGTYLSSHTAHPSFNAAAGAAQPSHMQFQGLFHPPQPGTMANQHHMGPGLGGNVGVGVVPSPPPSQVGTYQQSQIGHPNWPANF
ncbi:uncharacterized protein LOC17890679 isoform X2 [Capsella rubella]|uniref:uncharacterized protein LOC17890679 isoform X2 n=1 Tax=Capsella rubella TaxID=81985 RepID=UPI000CD4DEBF|nr:uncharacterized protein LOC17890679 isoform X2 [Capsella rubella]